MKITRRGSLWWGQPPNSYPFRDYASAAELRDAWRALIAAAANPPNPPVQPTRPVAMVQVAPTPAIPEQLYADPVDVVPQSVSWQGIVLEWPYYDEECATPWGGENTMAAPELTDRVTS